MSQMNILSTDAGQNLDTPGAKGGSSIKSQAKSNAFNDAMEQHYLRKKAEESEENTEPYGNFVSKAAEQHQEALKKERLSKGNEADDAHTLPVPLPIDDAETLSAPKAELKSYLGFQTQTQTQTEHQAQAQSGLAGNVENDDAVDLLKMLSGAEQLLKKSAANNTAEGIVQGGVPSGYMQTTTDGTTSLTREQESIDDAELMAKQAGIKALTEESNVGLDKASEFKPGSDIEAAQTHLVNQSTATVATASVTDTKLDVNQKTAINEDLDKLASAMLDGQKTAKTESDKLTPQVDKLVSDVNQTLVDQAKPLTSAAELAAQQEQSFESTVNQLTTNTVPTQKSFATMQTETIAIYRKDFSDAVKDKVMVMINQKIQQVEIQLDPPEMGNIHVRVNLQNEQAAVQFVVQNQQAREALEQNMGKLRDMLAQSGVDVGEANIEQREAKEQNGNGFDSQSNSGQNAQSAEDNFSENDNAIVNVLKASSTGIDYYA
ncbi:flagellar hook-length control protein FliK [Colwellia sp. MB3u-70]|uniref:flagellar hook-length control protein FliK n=1 Tax=unclassified Colwellia TaxID=196834 RepID=UPI0015F6A67D|nr:MULTISPECIES: flagellar hook-length control protein FliK [unclassified Colwellia]MBA6291791.1 flagellar hook-length control protein FliK [Colwellia sp. MB3u-8]MBA6308435.1 flagellar hook-length control protein FliK [Colwellia sp. MB3u-70]